MTHSASLTASWQYDVSVTDSTRLPPDAGYAKALTNQGYGFEVAVADLVDNSIDAGADSVVVHFLRDADRIVSLLVLDNGQGMDDAGLDNAMTVGRRRDYGGARTGIEDEIVRHIEEWRDSVQVGESVAIFELLDFSSSVYPGKHDPPADAVMDYVFSARVEGVEGISDVMPKRAARTA